jgi:hypothetical protein
MSQPPGLVMAKTETPGANALVESLLTMLVGLILVGVGAALSWKGYASQSWPSIQGTVMKCEVSFPGGGRGFRGGGTELRTELNISYFFEVDGKPYTGTEFDAGSGSLTGADIQAMTRQHPPESKITIFYDPSNPRSCLLEPGIRISGFAGSFFGLGFLLMGFSLLPVISRVTGMK